MKTVRVVPPWRRVMLLATVAIMPSAALAQSAPNWLSRVTHPGIPSVTTSDLVAEFATKADASTVQNALTAAASAQTMAAQAQTASAAAEGLAGTAVQAAGGNGSAVILGNGRTGAQVQASQAADEATLATYGSQISAAVAATAKANTALQPTGDASSTTIKALGSSTSRAQAAIAADAVDVKNFGAMGNAWHGYVSAAVASGQTLIPLVGTVPASVGQKVILAGAASGTTIANISNSGGNTTVTLSAPLSTAITANARADFYTQDDLPAFNAALAYMQATGIGEGYIPAGGYYLSGYVNSVPNIRWIGQNISFAPTGGIADSVNQSIPFDPVGLYLSSRFVGASQEQGVYVAVDNEAANSVFGYQKNAVAVQLNQGASSQYSFLGDPTTTVRDLVGYSAQGSCPSSNVKCSLFGGEMLMNMTGLGTMTGWELSVSNNSGTDNNEFGSWDNMSAETLLGGSEWQTGIDITYGSVTGKALAVRTEGARNGSGVATTHSDYAYVANSGALFGQSLHIAPGATTADNDPVGGVTIQSAAYGQIDLGNSTLASGPTPELNFHLPSGTSSDAYDLQLKDTGSALTVANAAGTSLLYANSSTMQIPANLTIQAANGTVFNAGNLIMQLTGSGFDTIRELGTKTLQIQDATGVANATFGQDGTTTIAASPVNNTNASAYTISTSDCGKTLQTTNNTTAGLTIPTGLPIGCKLDVVQIGTAPATFSAGSGESIEAVGAATKTSAQFATATVLINSASTFLLRGQVQ